MNRKKEILLAVLQDSWASLQLDGRAPGVELPDWLRVPAVTLQIGYDMPVPISDLAIDDEGVTATLSFRRVPFTCRIPWHAVFAIADIDGKGALFAEDLPPELSAAASTDGQSAPQAVPEATPPERPKSGKSRPSHLKLV